MKQMLRVDPAYPSLGMDAPFTVKVFDGVLDDGLWRQLVAEFPSEQYLNSLYAVGLKHRLCDRDEGFAPYVAEHPIWVEFFEGVRAEFRDVCVKSLGMSGGLNKVAIRFEFSSLPGEGGSVHPHPDTKKKVATGVLYCEPEWQDEWGGAFEALRHKTEPDADWTDRRPDWSEVDTILSVPIRPNRLALMKRSNVSLHGIRPMTAPRQRRSITINLIGRAG